MVNVLSFVEVTNIAVVHINMYTSKEKFINVHIEDRKVIHFKSYAEGIFCTNLNEPTMITNPTNGYINAYSYISTVKQNLVFLLNLKLKDLRNFECYSNIFTGRERQILSLTDEK